MIIKILADCLMIASVFLASFLGFVLIHFYMTQNLDIKTQYGVIPQWISLPLTLFFLVFSFKSAVFAGRFQ